MGEKLIKINYKLILFYNLPRLLNILFSNITHTVLQTMLRHLKKCTETELKEIHVQIYHE